MGTYRPVKPTDRPKLINVKGIFLKAEGWNRDRLGFGGSRNFMTAIAIRSSAKLTKLMTLVAQPIPIIGCMRWNVIG